MNKRSVRLIFTTATMSCMEVADTSVESFRVPKLSEDCANKKEEKGFKK